MRGGSLRAAENAQRGREAATPKEQQGCGAQRQRGQPRPQAREEQKQKQVTAAG